MNLMRNINSLSKLCWATHTHTHTSQNTERKVTSLSYKERLFSFEFPLGGCSHTLASGEGGSQNWRHRDTPTVISPSNPITCTEESAFHNICNITSGFHLVAPRKSHLLAVGSLFHDTETNTIYEAGLTFRISCSSRGSNLVLALSTFPTLWQDLKAVWCPDGWG